VFFFEKKNQKTFAYCAGLYGEVRLGLDGFLGLFFKKKVLA
jgi:hypothetical protein